ncbi:MAG: hypothetical protein AB8G77_01585, partial [Rhodothermales bacterium]
IKACILFDGRPFSFFLAAQKEQNALVSFKAVFVLLRAQKAHKRAPAKSMRTFIPLALIRTQGH